MESLRMAGVLGGLGPETTSKFNLNVTEKYLQHDPSRRPPILSVYLGLDMQLEKDFIEKGIRGEEYIPYLTQGAQTLERGGADFIVIPCNSVHVYIAEVRNSVGVDVLSIIEETEKFMSSRHIKNVGVLATPITVTSRLYQDPLESKNINVINPYQNEQDRLGIIIDRLVTNTDTPQDADDVKEIMQRLFQRGADSVILACTDFQLVIPSSPTVIDTMDILAEATVERLLSKNVL